MSAVGEIGRRVREQRKLVGFSQARLAEKLGVSNETVSRLETGRCTPSLRTIEEIARALRVDLVDLFRVRPEPTPHDEALDQLVWLMRRRSVPEVHFVVDLVTRIFEHMRLHPLADGKKEKRGP